MIEKTNANNGIDSASLHDLHGSFLEKSENRNFEETTNKVNSPLIPNTVYYNLPELLATGCSVFKSDRERDVFNTGALAVLSGIFNEVSGYYKGQKNHPNLYCFIVAPPASGKGVMNYAKKLGDGIHNRLATENEMAAISYKSAMSTFNAMCKQHKDAISLSTPPQEPIIKLLFVPANSSSAAIMRHIQQNNGCGIICETEIDTLANTFKQDWGGYSDLMRKAFHHEAFSYSRKTNNEYVEVPNPRIAIAMTGTPNQVTRLLVSNEDGLVSRIMFYCYNAAPVWQDVSPKDTINLDAHFHQLSERVYTIHENLKNKNVQVELTQEQWVRLNEFCSERLLGYGEDMRSTVTRIGLILFRITMVLTVLRNENNYTDGCKLVCENVDFEIACILADVYLSHAALVNKSLLMPRGRRADNIISKFFEALPMDTSFTRKEAVEIGEALSLGTRTIDKYLNVWCERGKLTLERHGTYRKM